jgi:hypothetical protein
MVKTQPEKLRSRNAYDFLLLGIPNNLIKMLKDERCLTFFTCKLVTRSSAPFPLHMVRHLIPIHLQQLTIPTAEPKYDLESTETYISNYDNLHASIECSKRNITHGEYTVRPTMNIQRTVDGK